MSLFQTSRFVSYIGIIILQRKKSVSMSRSSQIKKNTIRIGYVGDQARTVIENIIEAGLFSAYSRVNPDTVTYEDDPIKLKLAEILRMEPKSFEIQFRTYCQREWGYSIGRNTVANPFYLPLFFCHAASDLKKTKSDIQKSGLDLYCSILKLSSYLYIPIEELGKCLNFDFSNIADLFPKRCHAGMFWEESLNSVLAKRIFQQYHGNKVWDEYPQLISFFRDYIEDLPAKSKLELESFYSLLFDKGSERKIQRYIYKTRSRSFFANLVNDLNIEFADYDDLEVESLDWDYCLTPVDGRSTSIHGIFDVLFCESIPVSNLHLANRYKKKHPNTNIIVVRLIDHDIRQSDLTRYECVIDIDYKLPEFPFLKDKKVVYKGLWRHFWDPSNFQDEMEMWKPPVQGLELELTNFLIEKLGIKENENEWIKTLSPQSEALLKNILNAIKKYVHPITGPESIFQIYREIDLNNFNITADDNNDALNQLYVACCGDMNVLLLGETGTGKSELARIIHNNSERAHNPFLSIDCTSLHGNFLQSELFGHEKGAYTGADQRKIGLMELADGGTVFLDEIGELPNELQARLLDAIQNKRFRRLGGVQYIYSDFRIIAATNKNIDTLLRLGSFRTDLYYRIAHLTIEIPPLRERKKDITNIFWDRLYSFFIGKQYELLQQLVSPYKIIMLEGFDEAKAETLARAIHDFDLRHCRAIDKMNRSFVAMPLDILLQDKGQLVKLKKVVAHSNGGTVFVPNLGNLTWSCQRSIDFLLKEYKKDILEEHLVIDLPRFVLAYQDTFKEEELLLKDDNRRNYNKQELTGLSKKETAQKDNKKEMYKGLYFYLNSKSYKVSSRDIGFDLEKYSLDLQLDYKTSKDRNHWTPGVVPPEWEEYVRQLFPHQDEGDFIKTLLLHKWHGNIRELDGVLKYIFVIARKSGTVSSKDLCQRLSFEKFAFLPKEEGGILPQITESRVRENTFQPTWLEMFNNEEDLKSEVLESRTNEICKKYYEALRLYSKGSPEKAAKISGLSQKTISNKWNQYALSRPRTKRK